MPFKKLNPELLETLNRIGINEPLPFQEKVLQKIKSGSNIYAIGPDGIGKTTAIIISTLNKLNYEAFDDAPRAIILVKDKEAALELEEAFKRFTRGSDLRIFAAYEELKIELQREAIYLGVDIVIATPKRLSKLYFQNGINLKLLLLFIIEDAEFLSKVNFTTEIIRLSESISKCQYLIFTSQMERKLEVFNTHFMSNSRVIRN